MRVLSEVLTQLRNLLESLLDVLEEGCLKQKLADIYGYNNYRKVEIGGQYEEDLKRSLFLCGRDA